MAGRSWTRIFTHPYQHFSADHAHLADTAIRIPPHAVLATPYRWMLNDSRQGAGITDLGHLQLPPDNPPFPTPWVYSRERQNVLLTEAFRRTAGGRLIFLYAKDGHPLLDFGDDRSSRLVIGVGVIKKIHPISAYATKGSKATYPIWDRIVEHSIRPEGVEGFVLPYHDYLELPGSEAERMERLQAVAAVPSGVNPNDFSYGAEFVTADSAVSILMTLLESIRRIRADGLVDGPWQERMDWLNRCMVQCWTERGPFPGLGSALEAMGLRNATSMLFELQSQSSNQFARDPWPTVDSVLMGQSAPPHGTYAADIAQARPIWKFIKTKSERLEILQLLARFALTPSQASRWYDPHKRIGRISDRQLLENPYLLVELDDGGDRDAPINVATVDRGMLPDKAIAGESPLKAPTALETPQDWRRSRAAIVSLLKRAADRGDTILRADEVISSFHRLALSNPPELGPDWIGAYQTELADRVAVLEVPREPHKEPFFALQLVELASQEEDLRAWLRARTSAPAPILKTDWAKELEDSTPLAAPGDTRATAALTERALALSRATQRKFGALVGQAGTGKTTVVGTLVTCPELRAGGVLMLAPTGKARVRLNRAFRAALARRRVDETASALTPARTIAQFLVATSRYNLRTQTPIVRNDVPTHRRERTVVIDEASMITTTDLAAVLSALDLTHVERIILVGDPNQLPPIGPGRPFTDLVEYLQSKQGMGSADALGHLETEMRSAPGNPSAALSLASLFTDDGSTLAADGVLLDLQAGLTLNDLAVQLWSTSDQLMDALGAAMVQHLGLKSPLDVQGFDAALGLINGVVDFSQPNGSEHFQVLSPVRMKGHGVVELNKWIQRRYRESELRQARGPYGVSLGDEEIVHKDKVIQLRNESKREGYRHTDTSTDDYDLANGEIGLVGPKMPKGKALRVVFADRSNVTFTYESQEFPPGTGPLQLAYALTVHKAQGSDFDVVFFVLPKDCSLASRELLYTALTRSRTRLVLLLQGSDISELYSLSNPGNSDTAKRSTNLFRGGLRESDSSPYAEHLVHRLGSDTFRSRSEVIIAMELQHAGVAFRYERPVSGHDGTGPVKSDFSFETRAGDIIVWEHLGMMSKLRYNKGWQRKLDWYLANGFQLGKNLFTTTEVGGIDVDEIRVVIGKIKSIIE